MVDLKTLDDGPLVFRPISGRDSIFDAITFIEDDLSPYVKIKNKIKDTSSFIMIHVIMKNTQVFTKKRLLRTFCCTTD